MGLFGASGGGGLYAAGGNTATLNEGGGCGGMGLLHLEEVVVALIKLVVMHLAVHQEEADLLLQVKMEL